MTIKRDTLVDIADAIRSKTGKTEAIPVTNLASEIASITGGGSGGTEDTFNIAYGDTAPADTSKLWVKTSAPTTVEIADRVAHFGETLETAVFDYSRTIYDNVPVLAFNNKIYVMPGKYEHATGDRGVYSIDPETYEISSTIATLDFPYRGASCAVVGEKIYCFGGEDEDGDMFNTVRMYTPGTYKTVATFPLYLEDASLAAVGDRIYICGCMASGTSYSNPYVTGRMWVFNTTTNSITELPTNIGYAKTATAVIGTKIYLFGGQMDAGTTDTCWVYDTTADDLSSALSKLDVKLPTLGVYKAIVLGDTVYLVYQDRIYKFDLDTMSFVLLETATLPHERCAIAAVGDKIFLFGGYESAVNYYKDVSIITTKSTLSAGKLLVETCIHGKKADLVNANGTTLNLGIKNVYIGNSEGYAEKVPAYLYQDGAWVEV
jgi:hypothetical protein